MRGYGTLLICVSFGVLAAGCPKGKTDFNKGRKAESLQDYDAAFDFYLKALKTDPDNAGYRIKLNQTRFEASQLHVKEGVKLRDKGDLQGAISQFQRALVIDPASPVADQELQKTVALLAEKDHAADNAVPKSGDTEQLASSVPEIKPLSRAPINLKMVNDSKVVFDTIGKLAGLTVIYDPDYPARRINADLNNLTLEQALDIVALESKAFWKPITENIIMVIQDQTQKRRDYEEELVKTFYLSNTVQAQDLTEIVTGLRQLLELKRIMQLNSQNAIVIRDTPDKLALAEKMIRDIDKARPEVVVQVEVLEARTDRLRDLGVLPGQHASIALTGPNTTTTNGSTTTNTTSNNAGLTLQQLRHLNSTDYSVTLPSFTANAILTDNDTKIIQNPELRSVDGQTAKLRIGDKIPIATGSFQAGVGVGSVGGAGLVNPLVNTQFQYLDVGVNIDITPRVHPNREVSMKVKVEVTSHTGDQSIGGITQPVISQRTVEHDIRLREGEASILGGLEQKTVTKAINGWPGLAKVPLFRYLFSDNSNEVQEDEVLIVLIPHIVRIPDWTKENLKAMYSGTDTDVHVRKEAETKAPSVQPPAPSAAQPGPANPPKPSTEPEPGSVQEGAATGRIRFEPQTATLKVGQQMTIGVVVENVNDLFSIPLLLQYNPAVISVEESERGPFLSEGNQQIAIVQRVDKDRGQAIISATRQPNTIGVTGNGTLMGIVVKALAPGSSTLSIVQVNAKNSQQKPIPLVTSEASLQVQP